jgi:hypothetical protein
MTSSRVAPEARDKAGRLKLQQEIEPKKIVLD